LNRRDLLILGSTAIALPLVARAQQKAMPVIGWLHFGSAGSFAYQMPQFFEGLAQGGYVDGQNVAIEYRWAEGQIDRLPALAADLVGRQVNVITAIGPPSVIAAKKATSTIPIVFSAGIDPVAAGLVASLARPGGNITGLSILAGELVPKLLQLLSELLPQGKVFGLLVNPNEAHPWVHEVEQAARMQGLSLAVVNAGSDSEIDAALATLAGQHADALVIGDAVFFSSQWPKLVALASRYRLPTIDRFRQFADTGGLISYGPDLAEVIRHVGRYVARILKGEKPADLPVMQPTKFELVINLKTAKALGLTVPQSLLARADEVIE
jgi:putative ABC transport system substrate-binding protein